MKTESKRLCPPLFGRNFLRRDGLERIPKRGVQSDGNGCSRNVCPTGGWCRGSEKITPQANAPSMLAEEKVLPGGEINPCHARDAGLNSEFGYHFYGAAKPLITLPSNTTPASESKEKWNYFSMFKAVCGSGGVSSENWIPCFSSS